MDLVSTKATRFTQINVFLLATFILLIAGQVLQYSFFTGIARMGDLVGSRSLDSFKEQLDYVQNALSEGGLHRVLLTNGLLVVHFMRYLVAMPFVASEAALGPVGPLLLISFLMFPAAMAWSPVVEGRWTYRAMVALRGMLVFLPLLLSGRTVLVALGAGYIVIGLQAQRRDALLFVIAGILLVSFSSSAVFVCLLCAMAGWATKLRLGHPGKPLSVLAAILLGLLLVPSIAAKSVGFSTDRVGYTAIEILDDDAGVQMSEPLVTVTFLNTLGVDPSALPFSPVFEIADRVLSRSTLYVSYAYGQRSRLVVYIAMLLAAAGYLAWQLARREWVPMIMPVAVLTVGLFMEGLGAYAVLWPLVWAYTGPYRPRIHQFRYTSAQVGKG